MKSRNFDKSIQQNILAHNSDVDINAIWAAIEPQVDVINQQQENKRRRIFWLSLLMAALLLLTGSLYFFNTPNNTDVAASASVENPVMAEQNSSSATAAAPNNISTAAIAPVASEINTTSTSENHSSAITTNSLSSNATTTTNQASSSHTTQKEAVPTPIQNVSALPTAPSPPAATTRVVIDKEDTAPTANILPLDSQQDRSESMANVPEVTTPTQVNLSLFSGISSKNYSLLTVPEYQLSDELKLKASQLGSGPGWTGGSRNPYSLDIQLGIAFPHRRLSGPSDSINSMVLDQRIQTESPLEAIQLGIQINRQFRSGLEVSAGLHYGRITERFDYNTTLTTVDTIDGIVAYSIQINGDTIPIMGKVPVTTQTFLRKKIYNRYQLLDIPLLVGYRMQANNFIVGVQAGVMANVFLRTKGRILNASGLDQSIKNSDSDLFKSNVTFSYYFSFTTAYEIMPGIQLSFTPYAHIYPKSFTGSGNDLSQKYTLAGLKAGIRYQF